MDEGWNSQFSMEGFDNSEYDPTRPEFRLSDGPMPDLNFFNQTQSQDFDFASSGTFDSSMTDPNPTLFNPNQPQDSTSDSSNGFEINSSDLTLGQHQPTWTGNTGMQPFVDGFFSMNDQIPSLYNFEQTQRSGDDMELDANVHSVGSPRSNLNATTPEFESLPDQVFGIADGNVGCDSRIRTAIPAVENPQDMPLTEDEISKLVELAQSGELQSAPFLVGWSVEPYIPETLEPIPELTVAPIDLQLIPPQNVPVPVSNSALSSDIAPANPVPHLHFPNPPPPTKSIIQQPSRRKCPSTAMTALATNPRYCYLLPESRLKYARAQAPSKRSPPTPKKMRRVPKAAEEAMRKSPRPLPLENQLSLRTTFTCRWLVNEYDHESQSEKPRKCNKRFKGRAATVAHIHREHEIHGLDPERYYCFWSGCKNMDQTRALPQGLELGQHLKDCHLLLKAAPSKHGQPKGSRSQVGGLSIKQG